MNDALVAFKSGQADTAESILFRIIASSPKEANAFVALGAIAAETGRPEEAIERFKAALKIEPNLAQAQFYVGILTSHQGDALQAIPYLEKAVIAQPKNLQAVVALAQCLYQTEQPNHALTYFNKGLRIAPNDPGLLFSRASCLLKLFRDGEAESDLRAALAQAPDAKGLAKLAAIELSFNRFSEAIATARKSLELDPTDADPYVVIAKASMSLNRPSEAEENWEKARALSSKADDFFSEKANAFISVGRFEEAKAVFRLGLEVNPQRGEFWYGLVASGKFTEADLPLLAEIEAVAKGPGLTRQDELNLLYSMGKANDSLGKFEQAIGYFDKANALNKQMMSADHRFDREQFARHGDTQIRQYTPEFFAEHRDQGNSSKLPIIVLGMMRSGTTLLEQCLSRHPRIGGAGELPFWTDHEHDVVMTRPEDFDFRKLSQFAEQYLQVLASASPMSDRVTDKNPGNVMIAGLMATAFPNGKIIHIRRHPVDTVLSIWMTMMKTSAPFVNDRANIVFAYRQYQRLSAHWRESIPSDRFLEVSYEDLTESPEPVLRKILQFCGLDWDPICLQHDTNSRTVRTPSFWQVRQPLYRTSSEHRKNYLPWLREFSELMLE